MSIATPVDRVTRFEQIFVPHTSHSLHRCGASVLNEGQFQTEPIGNRGQHRHIRLFRRPNFLVFPGGDLFCDRGVNKPLLACESGADLAHN